MKNKLQLNAIKSLLFRHVPYSEEFTKNTFGTMKKFLFLFMALIISQNVLAVNKTWTGATSTNWATASNWSPSGAPTASDVALIPDVTNKPVIQSGTVTVLMIDLFQNSVLTVNSGATLNVTGYDLGANGNFYGILIRSSTFINNGTTNIQPLTGGNIDQPISSNDPSSIFNNTGTLTAISRYAGIVSLYSGNLAVNNSGTLNLSGGGRGIFTAAGGSMALTNSGTINYTGTTYAIATNLGSITNSNLITVSSGYGIDLSGSASIINNACSKIILSAGNYANNSGASTSNAGLLQIASGLTNAGTFTNTGVLKYASITGTVTNSGNASVAVNNTPTPIFTYGGTYNGTINGIYTNTTATTTAGTFTAPNTFVPSGLPLGSQTLYAKITPSGGACSYVVPFTYNYAPPTITAGAVTNAATCGGATGSIAFTTTNVANGTYSLTFNTTGTASPKSITVSSNTFTLSGLTAGAYNNFSLTVSGQTATTGTLSPAKTVADPALPNAGLTLSSGTLTATQAGAAYRWFTCPSTLVSGQTARTYTPTVSADYKVEVTLNGCVATSNCVSVAVLANDSFEKTNSFVLYPNPSKGIVTIDSQINGDFEITNQLGQKVTQFKVKEGSNTINLESLAEGVYFIKSKNNNFESQKIIIKH